MSKLIKTLLHLRYLTLALEIGEIICCAQIEEDLKAIQKTKTPGPPIPSIREDKKRWRLEIVYIIGNGQNQLSLFFFFWS